MSVDDCTVDNLPVEVFPSCWIKHLVVSAANGRWGVALGSGLKMEDSLWSGLTDSHAGLPMGMTAENLAVKVLCCR